jgi:hypothetical protein
VLVLMQACKRIRVRLREGQTRRESGAQSLRAFYLANWEEVAGWSNSSGGATMLRPWKRGGCECTPRGNLLREAEVVELDEALEAIESQQAGNSSDRFAEGKSLGHDAAEDDTHPPS